MILCESCRKKIDNPDESTFDFSQQTINTLFGEKIRITPVNWRIMCMLIAAGKNITSRKYICDDIYGTFDPPADPRHNLRERIYQLRRVLICTNWWIFNAGSDNLYLDRKSLEN